MQEAILKCEQITEDEYIDFREYFIKEKESTIPALLIDEKGLYFNGDLVCCDYPDEKGNSKYYINPTYKVQSL